MRGLCGLLVIAHGLCGSVLCHAGSVWTHQRRWLPRCPWACCSRCSRRLWPHHLHRAGELYGCIHIRIRRLCGHVLVTIQGSAMLSSSHGSCEVPSLSSSLAQGENKREAVTYLCHVCAPHPPKCGGLVGVPFCMGGPLETHLPTFTSHFHALGVVRVVRQKRRERMYLHHACIHHRVVVIDHTCWERVVVVAVLGLYDCIHVAVCRLGGHICIAV